ncbi:MAG TPA: hypothetical protein VI298_00605 [Geobacteraceae bacterium]
MRNSTSFIAVTSVNLALFALFMLHGRYSRGNEAALLKPCADLVKRLRLTDLCLFTEARYTRNPAMADSHAPFQDHPVALEHFPSGSLVTPPRFRPEAP